MIEQMITSSALIIIIAMLSQCMEKRIDPCIKYAIWLLVAIKLLLPMPGLESPIHIMNVADWLGEGAVEFSGDRESATEDSMAWTACSGGQVVAVDANGEAVGVGNGMTIDRNVGNQVAGNGMTENRNAGNQSALNGNMENGNIGSLPRIHWEDIMYLIWAAGSVACAFVFLWSNLRFAIKLRNSRVRIGCVHEKLNIYEASDIAGPCLYGLFKPAVYFPVGSKLTKRQREFALAHEYTHYRHRDHVWALVRCISVILYWYHPLVWLAASMSLRDSELAADAGALQRIDKEQHIEYGKALITIAKGMRKDSLHRHVLSSPTSAAGGRQEMKKRMEMIVNEPPTKLAAILALAVVCAAAVGCTYGKATNKEHVLLASMKCYHDLAGDVAENAVMKNSEEAKAREGENGYGDAENDMAAEGNSVAAILKKQEEADKVCIRIQPSGIRDSVYYYYIPEEKDQEWLKAYMDSLPSDGLPYAKRWKGRKETGWQIAYQNRRYMVFEGGYLYDSYIDENEGDMEYFVEAPKLCDYIQILLEELGYHKFNPADIESIVSAQLDVCGLFTDYELYTQTITDREILQMLEGWFRNATYIYGGAECGNERACLELTLADGETVRLSMATDSCPNFAINGVYYDYRAPNVRDNRAFFACFDEIPRGED